VCTKPAGWINLPDYRLADICDVMFYAAGSLPAGQLSVYQPQPFMQPMVCDASFLSHDELKIIIIISKTMFMVLSSWQSHCKSSLGSFVECRTAPSGRRPKTKPDDLGCESACTGCQNLHPPSPFIITQLKSWYSFYRPTESTWLAGYITEMVFPRTDSDPCWY